MDIRHWGLDRIMRLPDWCFGRRWPIGLSVKVVGVGSYFDIAEFALPETTIIWEIYSTTRYASGSESELTLAIGDHLPVTDAAFNLFELVMPGIVSPEGVRGAWETGYTKTFRLTTLRIPLETAGRNLVGRWIRRTGTTTRASCIVVVSSVPREVPDWLVSGLDKKQ